MSVSRAAQFPFEKDGIPPVTLRHIGLLGKTAVFFTEMPNLHEQYRGYTIEQLLKAIEADAEPGSPHSIYLEHLLSLRTAEMVNKQLTATAETISTSANLLKKTLENSSKWLINAIKVGTDEGSENAKLIVTNIEGLTQALTVASADIQKAGGQSAQLGRGLNRLTAIVAIAALISAGATAFAAWEAKRQADLTEHQMARAAPEKVPTSNTPAEKAGIVTPSPGLIKKGASR